MAATPRRRIGCYGLVVLAALIGLGGCIGSKFSLLPPISTQNPRDPNPMRPLVETPASQPRQEGYSAKAAAGQVGPVSTTVSAAAAMVWLFGGGSPLVGLFGTFDENAAFEKPATQPKPAAVP